MKFANLAGRAAIVAGGAAIDVETASHGRFPADPHAVLAQWADFRRWADAQSDRGDRPIVEVDLGAPQPLGPSLDVPVVYRDGRSHLLEGLEVEVDGAGADGAAAGEGHPSPSLSSNQGTQHEHGGPHRLHEVVGRFEGGEGPGLHLHGSADAEVHLGAEGGQHSAHGPDVAHFGDVRQDDALVGQERGAEVGEGGVLRPRDADGSLEGTSPDDADLVHELSVLYGETRLTRPVTEG